jgi:hypothetical protein
MGRLDDTVVLVTDTVPYGTARAGDREQTVAEVERLDRRILARDADVCWSEAVDAVGHNPAPAGP